MIFNHKRTDKPNKQKQAEPQEKLEFKITKARIIFFDILLDVDNSCADHEDRWMLGLTSLEIYNFFSKATRDSEKLQKYKPIEKKILWVVIFG